MPFIQARARFTNGDGRVVTDASNNLNVNLFVTNGPSNGVNIEFQAGYASASYILAINNSDSYIASDVANLIVDDPNGAVTVVPKTFGSDRYYEIISTGKSGIVTFGNNSNHKSFHIKDNYELPSGTAIKGFKSFGNLHINIAIEIKEHNFYVPNNISPTIEHIRFTTYPVSFGCHKFNDPNIVNWDVSNLKSMVNMFFRAESFNQDLSGWCVPQFTSEPNLFANGSLLAAANKPVWGTCPSKEIVSIGDIGFYRHQWGSDANLQQRRVFQTYVGSQVIIPPSGSPTGSSFSRSGLSNGYKWECSNKAALFTNTIGGPVVNALLSDTTLIYGDGTNVVQSITLNNLTITNLRPDGVDYNSITVVIRNKTKGVNHTFTFYKGITYMDHGTYGSHTAEFKALRARIEAIGTYGDQVEIASLTINPK